MNRKLDVAIFGVLPSVDLALLDSGRSVRRPAAKPQPQSLVKARTTTCSLQSECISILSRIFWRSRRPVSVTKYVSIPQLLSSARPAF
jgi:hypothetical protein